MILSRFVAQKCLPPQSLALSLSKAPLIYLRQQCSGQTVQSRYLVLKNQKMVGLWFFACGGLVFGTLVMGGITRLTESGLSMVDWRLIKGMKPPTDESQWLQEFDKYKQFPEYKYKTVDREMTLGEFKFIWCMEYGHRMIARVTGLCFILPAVYFLSKGYVKPSMKAPILLCGSLLVGEGLMGWYMVKSGLDTDSTAPRVSHYRLTSHLTLAFGLYVVLLWCGLSSVFPNNQNFLIPGVRKLRALSFLSLSGVLGTSIWGGLVSGLEAGLVYNSWPKFADRWIPSDLITMHPIWKNFFERETGTQFVHRNLGYATLAAVTATWLVGRRLPLAGRSRRVLQALLITAYAQVVIGIATLVHYVPLNLAITHQANSMVLITFATWFLNELRRFPIK